MDACRFESWLDPMLGEYLYFTNGRSREENKVVKIGSTIIIVDLCV